MDFNLNLQDINPIWVAAVGFFILFLSVFFILIKKKKEKGFLGRGMNLVLFLVTLPQRAEKGKEVSLEEFLKTSQQFYFSLAGIKEKSKINDFSLAIQLLFLKLPSLASAKRFIFTLLAQDF